MSGRVVGRVHERIFGSAARKAVALVLADHADPDGDGAYPSVNRIAQESELAESTVRACLAWLRGEGLIRITAPARQHRPATYSLDLARISDLQVVEVYRGQTSSTRRPDLQQPESRPPAPGPEPYLSTEPSLEPEEGSPEISAADAWGRVKAYFQRQTGSAPAMRGFYEEVVLPTMGIRWDNPNTLVVRTLKVAPAPGGRVLVPHGELLDDRVGALLGKLLESDMGRPIVVVYEAA